MPLDSRTTDYSGLVGSNIAGGLRVTQRTGSTSLGSLYEAEDLEGRQVVLLILPPSGPGQEPEGARSFKLATRIRHPNVAAVQAVGDLEDGSAYVVFERLVAEPLGDLLSTRPTYPIGEALELILQVAAGLEAAHHAGMVHGKLSPSTIVTTRAPFGKPQIKVIGFSLDTDLQRATVLGSDSTPYASPERRAGGPPDARGDIFSVGAVLHHMLSGRPPVDGQVEGVPRIARPVLGRALARHPADRFRTMSELREALEELAVAAVKPVDAVVYRRTLSRAIVAGLVLVVGGVLLAPVWRSIEQTRTPAITPPAAPANSAGRAEPSRSTVAGGTATAPRARRAAPKPATVDSQRRVPAEKRNDAPEVAGYMAQSPSSEMLPDITEPPPPPPPRASTSTPVAPRPAPVSAPKRRARSRGELLRSQALRFAIGDVTRVGLAKNVVEAQPGLLIVDLATHGMDVPSSTYNLQRLYLAYSAATIQPDTVALELRQDGRVYGWLTRDGLRYPGPDGGRP
ncbi:MAG TPA: serine/threonine-protein kinase [Gemmatimonadales bacterium]